MSLAPDVTDPFRHVPALRALIRDPLKSRYFNIDYDDLDRHAREMGRPPNWRRTDEEREATRAAILAGRLHDDMWIFAYGSLIWDPGFLFEEVRQAHVTGYRRNFCLLSTLGRGSDDLPGLMAALDTGGSCHGLVFRVGREKVDTETKRLWRREMIFPGYIPRFLPAATPQGPVEALAFTVMHDVAQYVGDLPQSETARLIATGVGRLGRNIEYLDNLADHFRTMGIEDAELFALHDEAHRIAGERKPAAG